MLSPTQYPCPAGTYSDENAIGSATDCKTCVFGFSDPGSSKCITCVRGTVLISTSPLECQVCPRGQFNPDVPLSANSICRDCEAGRFVVDEGTLASEHVACKTCDVGTEFNDARSACTICAAGKYQNSSTADNAECKWCPSGRFLTDPATKASLHTSAEDCVMCSIGREFKTVTDICTVCRASTYQDSSSSLPCKPCPNGRILVNEGREGEPDVPRHDDISDCTTCGKGTRFKKSDSPCVVCSAGKYQNRSDVDGVQCTFCPTARYLAVNGTVDDHSSFDDCKMCPVGKEILSVDRECQVCQGGRYQDQVQDYHSECKKCKVSHVICYCCFLCCFCFVFSLTPVLPLRLEHFWPTTEAKTHKTNTTMLEIVSIATPKHSAMLDHAIADLVQLVTKRFQAIQTVKRKRNVNHAPRVNTNQILPVARVCLAILEGTNRRAVFHIVCHVYRVNTKMDVASRRAKSVESTQNPIRPPRQSAVIAVLVNFPLAAAPSVLPV